jgi:FAD/FMN-containing dehydrogenase
MNEQPPVVSALINALGPDAVVTGEALQQRATSYWDASPTDALALLKPATTEEVSRVLKICREWNQPVVTQGGRTCCTQAADPRQEEVILSTERMTAIEKIDALGGTATVQAGAILETVQETLAEQDLLFPLDLGARGSCTIGGNVATNAGGINVLRYGMMRNLVLGLEAVLADGTVVSSMNQMLKNNAGYDLKQLFIGTEGTLGIVTRVVLRLFPQPRSCYTALVALENFEQTTALLQRLQRDLGGTLSAYEVMWNTYYQGVTGENAHRPPLARDYPFYALLEAEGADPESDGERFQSVIEQAFENGLIVDAVLPKSENERRQLWDIRENFEMITLQEPCYLYDVSLPISDMEEYANRVTEGVKQQWPNGNCYVFGHMADGNVHIFITPGVKGDLHQLSDQLVYEPLKEFNGSVSAEHGIGVEKKPWLEYSRTEVELALMKSLKSTLDPANLLNPGRVI